MALGVFFIITIILEINFSLFFLHLLTNAITLEASSYLILYKVEAWNEFIQRKTNFVEFFRSSIMIDRCYLRCVAYGILDLIENSNEPLEDLIRKEMNSLFYESI